MIPRRISREVIIGGVALGGQNPIRVQSMITSDTRDVDACVAEILELADAGCELVRLTAQTKKYAEYLEHITAKVRAANCQVPLVADIHFKADAAMEAVKWVDKVRVNPGNYADKKKFAVIEYTDEQYAQELERIYEAFSPLVKACKEYGKAMRIGTNHGSLSDRIMNRYGDTPQGMVESALEFASIAREHDFHNFVFSMKSSNPKVMISAYQLLVEALEAKGDDWNYPIHLGVTEAGDGEDGRTKSAIGIGSLLQKGIGDTIRVSLTEDPIHELPVAKQLIEQIEQARQQHESLPKDFVEDKYRDFSRRVADVVEIAQGSENLKFGGMNSIKVLTQNSLPFQGVKTDSNLPPADASLEELRDSLPLFEVNPLAQDALDQLKALERPHLVAVVDGVELTPISAYQYLAQLLQQVTIKHPLLLKDQLHNQTIDSCAALLHSSTQLGSLLCQGIGDAVFLRADAQEEQNVRHAFNILQASGCRIFKADYVACPSCGRTLFNLQDTTQKIRAATNHLKGVRIAVMGCIVNGPGEMADADFGYVGGAPNKINLYVGKTAVRFNIPEERAVIELIDLIKEHDKWVEPEELVSV